ncbi:MAG: DUF3800 domain-containing protein [Bacteroidales bacterium]|nr:DUF3800 domain-containing protein [Candidatus Sodaliphilus aphodohippi]
MIYIWLDESDKHGVKYSNFYGGILVESEHKKEVLERMENVKQHNDIRDEIKWQKVNEFHYNRYIAIVDELFDLAQEGKIKIRIFFRDNENQAPHLSKEQRKADYPMLYYQFIKYAFGFACCNSTDKEIGIRLFLDEIPLRQDEKIDFISHIRNLNNDPLFKKNKLKIVENGISEIDSKDHLPLQFVDLILGAVCFKLNEKDSLKHEENNHPGKRTLIKLKLYKHISERIRMIYPDFNIGTSTPVRDDSDRWIQVYRHWNFKPKHYNTDNYDPKP